MAFMNRIHQQFKVVLCAVTFLFAMFFSVTAVAKGKQISLTLQEAVAFALKNNADVKSAYLQRILDKFNLKLAKENYRIQPSFSFNTITTKLPRAFADADDRAFGVTPGLTWNTPYSTQFSFSWSNTLNNGAYGNAESFTVTQPLLKGFGKTIAEAPLNDALDAEIRAKMNLRQTLINTITTVITDYHALQQAQMSLRNVQRTLKNNKIHLQQDQLRVKAGELARTELSQDKYQVAQQQVQIGSSKNLVKDAQLKLSDDLGLDHLVKLVLPTKMVVPSVQPNRKLSEKIILANNISYQQAILGIKQAKRSLLLAKDNARWNLSLSATAGRQDSSFVGGDETNPNINYRPSSHSVVTDNQIQLSLSIPLGKERLQNKQAIAQARITLKDDQIKLAQQRLSLVNQVDDQVQRIKEDLINIHLAEKALQLQKQTLEATKIKIAYGMTSNFEWFSQQNAYESAEQTLMQNKMTYLNDLAQFDSLLGTTLNTWHVKVKY